MANLTTSTYPTVPAITAVVVPGLSSNSGAAPLAPPVAPAAATTGGGVAPAPDQAAVVALLQTLIALLSQMPGARGAQVGAAGVQGGGATPVTVGGPSFPPTTMGSFGALGATSMPSPFGSASSVGGTLLGSSLGTATSLSNGSVPSFLPSLGSITGGGSIGATAAPVAGAGFQPTTFGSFSAIGAAPSTTAFGSIATSASTIGGTVLSESPGITTTAAAPAVAGGGAAAAPAAAPQVDMRRVLGSPRPGDVIDTIIRAAIAAAQPSKSEGQYIVIQDANGAQLQAHVHGAWASHPTRIMEGIQRGFIQVHVHEDGTLHLHDVM